MPIRRDKKTGFLVFEFNRVIKDQRIRVRKRLPKSWNRAQADAYDRQESAKLYAVATGVQRPEFTIEDAVERYIKERCPELKAGANAAHELAHIFWAYQGRPITALADVCKAYAIKEKARLAPATIKNRIRYLTAACRYGWKHHGMSEHDPAAAVLVPTVKNERQTYIDRADMVRLARACKDRSVRACIKIAFYSGMRAGEILRAEQKDGFFVLHDTKNGSPRLVPIHPRLFSCLKIEKPTRFVLGYHFRAARAAVNLDGLKFHDLRHSAASSMINNDVDLYTVGAVLGHKSAASTKRYAHLATASLKTALMKIGKKAA